MRSWDKRKTASLAIRSQYVAAMYAGAITIPYSAGFIEYKGNRTESFAKATVPQKRFMPNRFCISQTSPLNSEP